MCSNYTIEYVIVTSNESLFRVIYPTLQCDCRYTSVIRHWLRELVVFYNLLFLHFYMLPYLLWVFLYRLIDSLLFKATVPPKYCFCRLLSLISFQTCIVLRRNIFRKMCMLARLQDKHLRDLKCFAYLNWRIMLNSCAV